MDLTKNEINIYIGTLHGILEDIKKMQSPSVKKIKDLIGKELARIKEQIKNELRKTEKEIH